MGKHIVHKANFARDCLLKVAGKKTEHNSPDPYGGFRYIQTSTAGHFGVIDYTGVTALLDAVAGTTSFPTKIPADYINIEGEVDISARIELNVRATHSLLSAFGSPRMLPQTHTQIWGGEVHVLCAKYKPRAVGSRSRVGPCRAAARSILCD